MCAYIYIYIYIYMVMWGYVGFRDIISSKNGESDKKNLGFKMERLFYSGVEGLG